MVLYVKPTSASVWSGSRPRKITCELGSLGTSRLLFGGPPLAVAGVAPGAGAALTLAFGFEYCC